MHNFSVESYLQIVVTCFTFTLLMIWLWTKKINTYPPFKKGFPLFGVMFSLGKYPEKVMAKWGKEYGNIYMVKIGLQNVVVLGSPDVAREAFTKHDCFNDRPQTLAIFQGGKGVVFVDRSDFQKEQRRFCLLSFRSLGMSRSLELRFIELTRTVCHKIEVRCRDESMSEPICITEMMHDLISSVISTLIFGHDVCADDENFSKLLSSFRQQRTANQLLALLIFAPFLKNIFPFSFVWNRATQFQSDFHTLIRKEIQKHLRTIDMQVPRDYIDCFLQETIKSKGKLTCLIK